MDRAGVLGHPNREGLPVQGGCAGALRTFFVDALRPLEGHEYGSYREAPPGLRFAPAGFRYRY